MNKNIILLCLFFISFVRVGAQDKVVNDNSGVSLFSLDSINGGLKNFENHLAGRIAGLQVTERSGMPGEGSQLQIACRQTMSQSNRPLYVIDGLLIDVENEESPIITGLINNYLNDLNSEDIESIQYVRGAAALIYGSQAGRGVIIINTKRNLSLQPKVTVNTRWGVNTRYRSFDMLNAQEYQNHAINLHKTKDEMFEVQKDHPNLFLVPNDVLYNNYNNNTNWQDEVYRTSLSQNYNINVQGGDAIAKYALTVGYTNDQGIVDNTDYRKYYMRFNTNINVTKSFEIDVNANLTQYTSDVVETGYEFNNNPVISAFTRTPMLAGNFIDSKQQVQDYFTKIASFNEVSNPLAILNDNRTFTKGHMLTTMINFRHKISDHLSHHLLFGVNSTSNRQNNFVSGITSNAVVPSIYFDGTAQNMTSHYIHKKWMSQTEYALQYNNDQVLNGFKVSGGLRYKTQNAESDYAIGANTRSDQFVTLNQADANKVRQILGDRTDLKLIQFFGSASLQLNKLLGFNAWLSYDGTETVGDNSDNYGLFYGVNLPLTLVDNKEGIINYLTVVPNYYKTANMNLNNSMLRRYYSSVQYVDIAGLQPYNIVNPDLKWEDVYGMELSLETKLFNHLYLNGTYYQNKTKDMVVREEIDSSNGFDFVYSNGGEKTSKGFSLGMAGEFNISKVAVNLYANVSKNVDEVSALPSSKAIFTNIPGGSLISEVGSGLYEFYGYQMMEVIPSKEKADQYNLTNKSGEQIQAGDIAFLDVDKNNIIDEDDRVKIGNPAPDFFGGFGINTRYKKWYFDLNFSYSVGNHVFNYTSMLTEGQSDGYNQSKAVLSAWVKEGDKTNIPRMNYGDPMQNNRFSSRFIEDGSFVKLKHAGIKYKTRVSNEVIRSLSISLDGYNLWFASEYKGADPEFSYSDNPIYQSVDYGKIPNAATVMLGLQVGF
ncbi:SusC/RagA family TonB-linked outer membrane protein [Saccharicrinis sp. GN24d3]|uniref:SusC/RagA family TonB-linked outer membrane protein n=1 Tax=Saccharicrinis sp. GN24d3 TaxID=3458416 RepID=UPI004035CE87